MIDRSASLRGIITGRGNRSGLTQGARSCHKRSAHRRMRLRSKELVRQELETLFEQDLEQDFGQDFEQDWLDDYGHPQQEWLVDAKRRHQEKLARRRFLYRQRKILKQVAQMLELSQKLSGLKHKLEPESKERLSELLAQSPLSEFILS